MFIVSIGFAWNSNISGANHTNWISEDGESMEVRDVLGVFHFVAEGPVATFDSNVF